MGHTYGSDELAGDLSHDGSNDHLHDSSSNVGDDLSSVDEDDVRDSYNFNQLDSPSPVGPQNHSPQRTPASARH